MEITKPKKALPGIDVNDARLVGEKEAARILGMSIRTLQQRRYLGQEPKFIRLPGSRSVRYWIPHLYEYIQNGIREFGGDII